MPSSTSDNKSDLQPSESEFFPPIDPSLTVSDMSKLQDWNNAQRKDANDTENQES